MDHTTYIVVLVVIWLVVSTLSSFYRMFHAPRCPEATKSRACLGPMFEDGELVDVLVYLTAKEGLRWWKSAGWQELLQAPLWNITNLSYGQPVAPLEVVVPLSLPGLHAVRKNQSALYAHCFLVRGGHRLEESLQKPKRGVLSVNALHTSATLTRLLPHVASKRVSLLSAASSESGSEREEEEASDTNSSAAKSDPEPVSVTLPLLGWVLRVYPGEALSWTASAFSTTAFLEPRPPAAAFRGGLAAVVAPWLWQLHSQQMERLRAKKRQKALEDSLWRQQRAVLTPHLLPLVRISLPVDDQLYDRNFPPPLLYKEVVFENGAQMPTGERDIRYAVVGDAQKRYAPPLTIDPFGVSQRSWRPLDPNISKPDPEVMLKVDVDSMMRFSIVETMKQSLQVYTNFGLQERDLEDLFRYPLHIMIIMQVIGFLQMMLTTLAFKNDISFFRGRSDYTGLSSRSLATDTLQEIVIFLYLYDYDDISRIVLFQVGTSAAISAWKYARVARLGLYWCYFLPWVSYNRGAGASQEEQGTEEIDARGMRYLKFVLYPLSAVWGLYNLYHYHYKSWWSWLVSSMADFAYTFGFINMMPQIFINYKLKSVAHMPWRVLMYKFFNTFIDDVFAFFIMSDYMTKKHRFMTLRDDIVFFVFLYQRHVYKVDPNRPDEFGFVYADTQASASDQNEAIASAEKEAIAPESSKASAEPAQGDGAEDRVKAAEAEGNQNDSSLAETKASMAPSGCVQRSPYQSASD